MTIEELIARGYRRVSSKYGHVARIDRPDWKEVLAAHLMRSIADLYIMDSIATAPGYRVSDRVSSGWCDYYRRILSKDVVVLSPMEAKQIPTSSHDPAEYVET